MVRIFAHSEGRQVAINRWLRVRSYRNLTAYYYSSFASLNHNTGIPACLAPPVIGVLRNPVTLIQIEPRSKGLG